MGTDNVFEINFKNKKEYILITIIAIVLPLYVFSPALTNPYYVADQDVTERYPMIEKLRDPSLFPNYRYVHQFLELNSNVTRFFIYFILILRYFFPMNYIYNFVMPILLSLIIVYSLYNIGRAIKNKKLGAILVMLGTIHMWSMEHLRESVEHCIGLALVYPFLYFLISKKEKEMLLIMILGAIFYPPVFLLLFVVYVLSKINWKRFKLVDARKSISKIAMVLIFALILMSFNVNVSDRISKKEARPMPEFGVGGFTPIFFDNMFHGIFSNSDDLEIGLILFDKSSLRFGLVADEFSILLVMSIVLFIINCKLICRSLPKKVWLLPISGVILYIAVLTFILDIPLHIPSRYFEFSRVPFLLIISGIGIYYPFMRIKLPFVLKTISLALILFLIYMPFIAPNENECEYGSLYDTIESLPKDALISGTPADKSGLKCIPILSKRKVITANCFTEESSMFKEWNKVEREINYDTFKAYYSKEQKEIINYCNKYGITHIILSNYTFSEEYLNKDFLYYQPYNNYIKNITKSRDFYFKKIYEDGQLFEGGKVSLIKCDTLLSSTDD